MVGKGGIKGLFGLLGDNKGMVGREGDAVRIFSVLVEGGEVPVDRVTYGAEVFSSGAKKRRVCGVPDDFSELVRLQCGGDEPVFLLGLGEDCL